VAKHIYHLVDAGTETWETITSGTGNLGLHAINLQVSYSHPARLTFRLTAKDYERPIKDRAFLVFWDDAADPAQDVSTPAFEGHVQEIKPISSNVIEYLCFDSTMRVRNEVTVMNGPHGDAGVIPRMVVNATIDNDEDYGVCFDFEMTVGEILEMLLTHGYNEIFTTHTAAPSVPGEDCFDTADTSALTFEPQEKIVFESEQIGSAIDRLMQYYPTHRLIYIPGTGTGKRKWRFVNVKTAPQVTLTLGQFGGDAENLVLSRSLQRSHLQRWTAIEIYGPKDPVYTTARVSDGDLAEGWTSGQEIAFLASGPYQLPAAIGDAAKKWQVVDADKRRISRYIPAGVYVPDSGFSFAGLQLQYREIKEPLLQVSFDGDNFHTVQSIRIDGRDGYVYSPIPLYARNDGSFGTLFSGDWAMPIDAILHYAYYDEPEVIRWPTTGFTGTAYSESGMEATYKYYDPSFAFGYDKLRASDYTANRIAQYLELAKQWLEPRKDIVHSGGCTLAGIRWEFLRLQKRINFASLDDNGDPETIGTEAIDAILTDVEFDFAQNTTTLVFDSDMLNFQRRDIDALKRFLKIKAFSVQQQINYSYNFGQEIRVTTDIVNLIIEEGPNGPEIVGTAGG
jgi:hypothetical protein